MKKNHKLPLSMVLSGGVLLIIILATLLATLSPYDPIAVETGQKFLPPSAQHLLGTDNFGRDTFTRLLYGGRVSLLVGFLSMLISIVFGTVYGIVSGSSGKLVDGFMMRIVDILMSVPSFLIIITLNIYMNAGIRTLVVTIGLFSWMGVARIGPGGGAESAGAGLHSGLRGAGRPEELGHHPTLCPQRLFPGAGGLHQQHRLRHFDGVVPELSGLRHLHPQPFLGRYAGGRPDLHSHPPLTGGLSGRVHPADRSVLQCAGQRLPPPLQPQFREVSHASI